MPTTYDRATIEILLQEAAVAQGLFWDALHALETELGVELELDNDDLSNHDIDSLIALTEGDDDVFEPLEAPADWNEVKQTTCRYCEQDIEGFKPFPEGEWRDRGNNTHCPNDSGKLHAPYIAKGEE